MFQEGEVIVLVANDAWIAMRKEGKQQDADKGDQNTIDATDLLTLIVLHIHIFLGRSPLESCQQDASVLPDDHQCHSALALLDILALLVGLSDVGQEEVPREQLIDGSDVFSLINLLQFLAASSVVLPECLNSLLHQLDASLLYDLLQSGQLSASQVAEEGPEDMFVGELDVVLLFLLEALPGDLGGWLDEGVGIQRLQEGLDDLGGAREDVLVEGVLREALLLHLLGGSRHSIVVKIITEPHQTLLLH